MSGSRAKNWCFTLNNYNETDEARVSDLYVGCVYVVYGREVGENGTRHLQGFCSFSSRVYFSVVRRWIGGDDNRAHIETARNILASVQYCKKDGDFVEIGELPSGTGSRSDFEKFKADVKDGMLSMKRIREEHSSLYAKHARFCIEYVHDNTPVPVHETFPLRDWQQDLYSLLTHEVHDREIIFVVDVIGNTGKSWFCRYYCSLHENAQIVLPGRKADMCYALRTDIRVLFVDAPRSKQNEFLQYDFFEEVKNGLVFSSKYESRIKYLGKVHVVVLMNEQPDHTKLSRDRYKVINLE